MSQDRPQQTFTVTVKTKSEEEDGFTLELEIPDFRSRWPTKVQRVDRDMARLLVPGESYNVVLERQNLKRGTNPDSYFNWYWGLVRIALPGDQEPSHDPEDQSDRPAPIEEAPPQGAPQRPQPAQPPAARPQSSGGWAEAYSQSQECKEIERVSIEAQVAAKIAAELLGTILVTLEETEAKAGAVDAYLERLTLVAMASIQAAKRG